MVRVNYSHALRYIYIHSSIHIYNVCISKSRQSKNQSKYDTWIIDNWTQLNPIVAVYLRQPHIFITLNTTTPMITMFMHVIYYEHIISLQIYIHTHWFASYILICCSVCGYPFKIWQFNLHKIGINVVNLYGYVEMVEICQPIYTSIHSRYI